jgi:hypothetical protein
LIIDPDETVTTIGVNGTHSEEGMTLYVTYLGNVEQKDLAYTVYGSNSGAALSKVLVGTTLPRSF